MQILSKRTAGNPPDPWLQTDRRYNVDCSYIRAAIVNVQKLEVSPLLVLALYMFEGPTKYKQGMHHNVILKNTKKLYNN